MIKTRKGEERTSPLLYQLFSPQRNKGRQHLLWMVGTWPSDRNTKDGTSLKIRLQVKMNLLEVKVFSSLHHAWKGSIRQDEEHVSEGAWLC